MTKPLSNKEFEERAKRKHGDNYNYSEVRYVDSATNIDIICPIHGNFLQSPTRHLSGARCPKCMRESKVLHAKELFIADAKISHGDKYDYSRIVYKNSNTRIKIVCPFHGEYEQLPKHHKRGAGCPKCGHQRLSNQNRDNQDKVIADFISVHGYQYDYTLVKYTAAHIKVDIMCPEHGIFRQQPNIHKDGHGCPKCAYERNGHRKRRPQDEVISDFHKVHGDIYDYSLVDYHLAHEKVAIICPTHRVFLQTPNNHRSGKGCPSCGHKTPSNEELIKEFKRIHGDLYDYSLTEYVDMRTPIKIICKRHGLFEQLPGGNGHKGGAGCPLCAYELAGDFHRLSQEEVILQFKAVHRDKYDYSLVDYQGTDRPVKIVCPDHGVFKQVPSSHKSGAGCPVCVDYGRLTLDEIITQFIIIHGDRYDYSLVDYVSSYEPVKIVCKMTENGETTFLMLSIG